MKKLVVFGGTGRTGLAVLIRASECQDIEVTAFLRKPQKVSQKVKSKIKLVVGNVLNADEVANVIEGQDAVISCLGTGFNISTTTVISEGVKNIVAGMRKHGVKRIALVGVSFLLPGEKPIYLLKAVTEDHERALNYIKTCKDIDWTMCMPPEIVDLSFTGNYKVAINKLAGTKVATTHDIADWMISCVRKDENAKEYKHQLVGIASFLSTSQWLTGTISGLFTMIGIGIILVAVCYYSLVKETYF